MHGPIQKIALIVTVLISFTSGTDSIEADDSVRSEWANRELRKIDLAYRNDGFSQFYDCPVPMRAEDLTTRYVDPCGNSDITTLFWGLGPGSVFCFDTKVGEIFGAPLSDEQWQMMRLGDRRVYDNVAGLIEAGHDPLRLAADRGHELGLKVIARLEMNHEYGPASDENWKWVGLVGSLNKQHPEYRQPRRVLLDYKHQEVRDFKIAILREAAQTGVDGISLDLAVYPPFFEKPDSAIMTQFIRDVRTMLDEEGGKLGRRLELRVRVVAGEAEGQGLDWKTWMRDGLIDYILPTNTRKFDFDIGPFVSMGRETGVKVMPTVWQALGITDTDQRPGDEKNKRRRYTKPKTRGMYFAQALLQMRGGADGIQLGFAANALTGRPWLAELADPANVLFADKHYMVNPKDGPFRFNQEGNEPAIHTASLRVGDWIADARRQGHAAQAKIVLFGDRPLGPGEKVSISINGHGPVVADTSTGFAKPSEGAQRAKGKAYHEAIYEKDWWRQGEQTVDITADWLELGRNTIEMEYRSDKPAEPYTVKWIDLLIDYE